MAFEEKDLCERLKLKQDYGRKILYHCLNLAVDPEVEVLDPEIKQNDI